MQTVSVIVQKFYVQMQSERRWRGSQWIWNECEDVVKGFSEEVKGAVAQLTLVKKRSLWK